MANALGSYEATTHHRQLSNEGTSLNKPVDLAGSLDVSFMFICGFMVMFMQLGFAAVCCRPHLPFVCRS